MRKWSPSNCPVEAYKTLSLKRRIKFLMYNGWQNTQHTVTLAEITNGALENMSTVRNNQPIKSFLHFFNVCKFWHQEINLALFGPRRVKGPNVCILRHRRFWFAPDVTKAPQQPLGVLPNQAQKWNCSVIFIAWHETNRNYTKQGFKPKAWEKKQDYPGQGIVDEVTRKLPKRRIRVTH